MRTSPWQEIEKRWPAQAAGRPGAFAAIRQKARRLLAAWEIPTGLFSHYGLVVPDLGRALAALNRFYQLKKADVITARVAPYKVRVARCRVAGRELEFVAPVGPGFFNDFLKTSGEGLHHLSFYTPDLRAGFAKLRRHRATLLDAAPRQGSHGLILFFKPAWPAAILIELCQKNNQGDKHA